VAFKNDPVKLALASGVFLSKESIYAGRGHLWICPSQTSARRALEARSRSARVRSLSANSGANVPRFSLAIARTRPPARIVCPRTSGSSCPRGDAATEIRFPDYRSHRRENSIFHAIRPSSRPPSPSHRRCRLGCGARRRGARLYERTYLPGRTVSG